MTDIFNTTTNTTAMPGDAFRAIRAHALSIGWGADEVDLMARDLDAAIYLGEGDAERAYELADALDVLGAGFEVRPA